MLYEEQSLMTMRHRANEEFRRLHNQAVRSKLWSRLTRQSRTLLNLNEVQANTTITARRHAGVQLVPVDQILGSEGRCSDFDTEFRPLREQSKERWVNIAVAQSREEMLPVVELVQLGGAYFVRDGHHRISVAKTRGQREMEAEVTVWQNQAANN
jgi:hypothetical protein